MERPFLLCKIHIKEVWKFNSNELVSHYDEKYMCGLSIYCVDYSKYL